MGLVFAEEYARAFRLHQTLVWVKQTLVLGHSDYHYMHENVNLRLARRRRAAVVRPARPHDAGARSS